VPVQQSQGNGWFARAKRLLDDAGEERVEYGLLLCTQGYKKIVEGDFTAAFDIVEQAARVGTQFADIDVTLARHAGARAYTDESTR
jgi:hypothetical protein